MMTIVAQLISYSDLPLVVVLMWKYDVSAAVRVPRLIDILLFIEACSVGRNWLERLNEGSLKSSLSWEEFHLPSSPSQSSLKMFHTKTLCQNDQPLYLIIEASILKFIILANPQDISFFYRHSLWLHSTT